jgi:Big-like domain-containing protein/parallel beta helix pectate lyase-like protein
MNTQAFSCMRGRAARYAAAALGAAVLASGALAPADAQAAAPTALYVSQGGLDSGTCTSANPCATVSYALTQAASGATIKVSGTIKDKPVISSPVTITTWPNGPAVSPAVLDGTASGAVVTVNGVAGVTLNDLTIEHGSLGVYNIEGTVTLTDSTVSGNATSAEPYAGILNYGGGTMTIIDSTVAKNSGAPGGVGVGAGVYNTGTLTIIASTISGNTGGGIYSGQGRIATLGATIVAGNTGGNCVGYDAGSLVSAGYNLTNDTTGTACAFTAATDLVNKNPLLGALASNGGPTQTMLPGTKSPAANVIPNPTLPLRGVPVCPATDQRGVARPGQGETRCTIGAAEAAFSIGTTTSVTVSPATVKAGARVIYLAVVTPKSGTGTPAGTITFTTGATTLCTAVLSGGVAACGATNAPAGTDTVTGKYSGGSGYASSSGTATLTVT